MYKIFWNSKAVRQLEKIKNYKAKNSIIEAVSRLENFKSLKGESIKMLKNHSFDFRLRVGKYRVLFSVKEILKVINIEEVKKRDERTY